MWSSETSTLAFGDTGRLVDILSTTSLGLVPLSSDPLLLLELCRLFAPRLSCLLYVPLLVIVSNDDVKAGVALTISANMIQGSYVD